MPANHDNWDVLLRAWLHDPVDKPADIRGHEARAEKYARTALNEDVSVSELKIRYADPTASAADRLPMPALGGDYENLAVVPDSNNCLLTIHPFSGKHRTIKTGIASEKVEKVLLQLAPHHGDRKTDFLSLWRFAPERLEAETGFDFESFPAETRNPDHTLWHHLDITAAFALAMRRGTSRPALLSFKLGPVQPFIEASRSLRDLLTGSWLLSILAFAAIEPVLEECGPTALIYPSLRGLPLLDWWLEKQRVPNVRLDPSTLACPSIPHRFLAIVPSDRADTLSRACVAGPKHRWREIAASVRTHLKRQLDADFPGWDRHWDDQVESYFDFRTSLVEYNLPDVAQKEFLGETALGDADEIASLGFKGGILPGHWQRITRISSILMESVSSIRHVPGYRINGQEVPQKCTLLGSYEQMGPSKLSESTAFWEMFHKLNSAGEDADDPDTPSSSNRRFNDRLCAVALTKRLAAFHYASTTMGIPKSEFRIADTRTFARRSGPDFVYYALLAFDGDHMGRWLSGENSLTIQEVLHPKIVAHHKRLKGEKHLERQRPVSPALHASFSARLTRFATVHVPRIVKQHEGTLIYSGGDDVLAALPLTSALACAQELRRAFSQDDVLGDRATASAGLAIAHYKEDLRFALQAARDAEQAAKAKGRNRIAIAALRRSGGHVTTVCSWDYLETLRKQFELFDPQGPHHVSDRWTYTLRTQLETLNALPGDAFLAEMRRILKRSESAKRFVDVFVSLYAESGLSPQEFIDLAQTASFMTRGKDN